LGSSALGLQTCDGQAFIANPKRLNSTIAKFELNGTWPKNE